MGRSCRRKFAEAGWQEKDGSSTYVLEVADQGIPPVRTYLSHDSACYNGCSSSGLAAVYSYATQAGTASLSGKGGSRGSVRASARPLASPHQHQQARKPPTSALPPPCAASARAWVASGDGRQRAASARDRPAHALAATARAPCLPAPARAGAWAIVSRCVTAPATAHVRRHSARLADPFGEGVPRPSVPRHAVVRRAPHATLTFRRVRPGCFRADERNPWLFLSWEARCDGSVFGLPVGSARSRSRTWDSTSRSRSSRPSIRLAALESELIRHTDNWKQYLSSACKSGVLVV